MRSGRGSLFLLLAALAPVAQAESFLRIETANDPALFAQPALHSFDYGAFRWLVVADDDAAQLVSAGRGDLVVQDAGEIRVPGYSFDPLRVGEPDLAAELRANPAEEGLRLVQLWGPPRADWFQTLEAAGLRVLQYYPHNAYLVWAAPANAAAARDLPFVRWVGDFHPAYKRGSTLANRSGRVRNLVAFTYAAGKPEEAAENVARLGATVLRTGRASGDGMFANVEFVADATEIANVAALPNVLWIGYRSPRPVLDDEMSDQIVAGNHPGGAPVTGYNAHLASLGVDGSGIVWAISDTGIDWDHPDLGSHIIGGFSPADAACIVPGQPGSDCASGGHGTHVSGIAAGDASAGFTDANGFLYGLGVAPETSLFALNIFGTIALEEMTQTAILGGAIGSNNSWSTTGLAGVGYTADARLEDVLVRDGDLDTAAVAEPFLQVFSAGNSGSGASTITEPKEAKNILSVANSFNARAGSIDTISSSSSRGPAIDGRTLPTIAAPGSQIASTRNDTGGSCSTAISGTSSRYAFCSGTSMASPHVSGAVVLLADWWRPLHGGATPSLAVAKALLVNASADMGTADVPNNNEGWGRVQITRVIDPAVNVLAFDQQQTLTGTGQQIVRQFEVDTPGQPLRITLAWSDAPGAAGANPALVNNLDLAVAYNSQTYRGNVFASGASVPGGSADLLNNLENVFLTSSVAGPITVTITGSAIGGDGVPYNGFPTDQDFALVCSNCRLPGLFADGFESADTAAWSATVP